MFATGVGKNIIPHWDVYV